MRSGTIAFIAGILCLQQLNHLPPAGLAWAGLILLPLCYFTPYRIYKLACLLVLGLLWANWHAHTQLDQKLPHELEGKDLVVEGYIANLPVKRGRKWRFEFDITKAVNTKAGDSSKRILHGQRVILNGYKMTARPGAGEYWRLTIRLKRPAGFMNPGGFDYEGWLFSRHISATGYIRNKPPAIRLAQAGWRYPGQRLRQAALNMLDKSGPSSDASGIIAALAIGHRDGISSTQWALFRKTGTNHLVAISGLHIGLVAGLFYFIINWSWRRHHRLALWLAAPRAAALIAILAASFYATLAGWSLPTQRAMIMITVVMLAIYFQRNQAVSQTLAMALLLVVLLDPLSVMSPGLWLSFVAVGVILYVITGRSQSGHRLWQWGKIQWAVSLGLAPLLLFFFQAASLIAPLANLIAVPLVSLLIVPLVLAGMLSLALFQQAGVLLLQVAGFLLEQMMSMMGWLAALPYSEWHAPVPGLAVLILAVAGLGSLLAPRGWPMRLGGVVLLFPLIMHRPEFPQQGKFWFTLLDVGQGLSAVVQTRQHVLVYDAGPAWSKRFDTGEAVVLPYLRQAGVKRIDTLLVSHGDNDHIGGVRGLLKGVTIDRLLTSDPGLRRRQEAEPCLAGQRWSWDGVLFEMLSPGLAGLSNSENNQSCVLRVSNGSQSLLLPGDIEASAEQAMLAHYPARQLSAQLLVAPHHGSKTSSSSEFLAAVRPDYVLYPVGYRNRYRFPHRVVTRRYDNLGVNALATDHDGAILFRPDEQGGWLAPIRWRKQARRYWHR